MKIIRESPVTERETSLTTLGTGCIAVAVFEHSKLSVEARQLNASKAISAALKSGSISGKVGSGLLLGKLPGIAAKRVLLLGVGGSTGVTDEALHDAKQIGLRTFEALCAENPVLAFSSVNVD